MTDLHDPEHARRVAWLLGVDVDHHTPVRVGASPTRTTDRAAAWRTLAQALPIGGLLVTPLDVLPGDHLPRAVREQAQLYATRHGLELETAVRRLVPLALEFDVGKTAWREWLMQVRVGLDTDAPWIDRLWSPDLNPGSLVDLVAEARDAGLGWVCDARLASTSLALLPRVARAYADDDMARTGDRVRGEQLADLLRNQIARVGLFVRGPAPAAPSVDPDRVMALSWRADRPDWARWALESLDARAASELDAPDTPPRTRDVVALLARDTASVSASTLEEAIGANVGPALIAAWALGYAAPAGPLP